MAKWQISPKGLGICASLHLFKMRLWVCVHQAIMTLPLSEFCNSSELLEEVERSIEKHREATIRVTATGLC